VIIYLLASIKPINAIKNPRPKIPNPIAATRSQEYFEVIETLFQKDDIRSFYHVLSLSSENSEYQIF